MAPKREISGRFWRMVLWRDLVFLLLFAQSSMLGTSYPPAIIGIKYTSELSGTKVVSK
jgi:hypothetical protein